MNNEAIYNDEADISGLGKEDLAYLIKKARKRLNLSQRKFADRVNITQAQLCRIENGSSIKPNKKTIRALAPYIPDKSYAQLLAYAGYTLIDEGAFEDTETSEDSIFSSDCFSGLSPEIIKMFQEIPKFLTDPKNSLLLQKVVNLMERISEKEGDYEEQQRMITLRDCVLNIIQ